MSQDVFTDSSTRPNRLLSLDAFRGLTVAAMILVNNPGDWGHIYPPLEHAAWNGCTPTDLIFPFFLFIVGVAIPFAMGSKKADATQHTAVLWKVLRRTLTLFCLGLFLSLFPKFNFSVVRIPGVLQRIAVVYGICSFIFIKADRKTQFRLFWAFLVVYYLLMTLVPVPGVGYANLEPETNLGAWIDRTVIGTQHLWRQSKTWDPEGLLGTIPALSTCLFGILIGTWLKRKDKEAAVKVATMYSVGVAAVLLGYICNAFFPINKSLWTSSYVLFAGGWATLGFTLFYWLIDVKGYRRYVTPMVAFGVNAITVFFLSGLIPRILNLIKVNYNGQELGGKEFLYQKFFVPYFSPINASLAGAITFVFIWAVILWIMYRKNIIIKI